MNASNAVVEEAQANIGAEIMGRGKFGGEPGPWGEDPWRGWWGEDPPFHMPVFVLTHHQREPLTLSDTTFTFVTGGIEAALEQAPTSRTNERTPGRCRRRPCAGRSPRRSSGFVLLSFDQCAAGKG